MKYFVICVVLALVMIVGCAKKSATEATKPAATKSDSVVVKTTTSSSVVVKTSTESVKRTDDRKKK